MSLRLDGKVAVVTGAASGIGAGTARRFVEEGARVVLVDLDLDRGKVLAGELGGAARFAEADVADEDALAVAIDLAVAEFGRLDVMFNNAGILGAVGPIADTAADAWDRTIAVLLRSVFLGMKHAARVMIPQGSGVILSTSSIAGTTGGLGPHGYTACKHAVVGLTKSVAVELAPHGIRVNAIAPGMTVTAMTAFTYTGDPDALETTTETIRAKSPLGIAGQPVDIANAALYLASDEARYVSGHLLVVDAAQTANGGSRHFASMDAGHVDVGKTGAVTRPFRFAVQSYAADSANEWTERARRAEALGYSVLHLADHYIGPGPALASTNHPVQSLAAVPAMAFAAAATTTLRMGCRVLCIDYHHPIVLAKELATLDLLSGGRIEVGLGAGWLAAEYDAMGIPFDPAGVRVERLAAVIDLLRDCFAAGELKFDRAGVVVSGFEAVPKGVQPGGPPLMVGGGSPRVLRLAGAKADIVSLNFDNSSGRIGADGVGSATADRTATKVGWVRDGAGERFEEIELEIGAYFTAVSDRPDEVLEGYSAALGLPVAALADHPHVLVGSVDAIVETLERRREAYGISCVTVSGSAMDTFAPVVARLSGT